MTETIINITPSGKIHLNKVLYSVYVYEVYTNMVQGTIGLVSSELFPGFICHLRGRQASANEF